MDFNKQKGWHHDYNRIIQLLKDYRGEKVYEGNWRGFKVTTDEFIRGLEVGTYQTIRKKDVSTQTVQCDTKDASTQTIQYDPEDWASTDYDSDPGPSQKRSQSVQIVQASPEMFFDSPKGSPDLFSQPI